MSRRIAFVLVGALVAAAALLVGTEGGFVVGWLRAQGIGARSVEGVLAEIGPAVEGRLRPRVERAGVTWPPARTTWIAIKDEKRLEAWVANADGPFQRLAVYAVRAASGGPGPKRREGDRQVPEGFYALTDLNPNSRFHLSVRVAYPNDEDVAHRTVPRSGMGGDIFVHGSDRSKGCLAVGDDAIEELFVLAARVPPEGRRMLLVPTDFRVHPEAATADDPWVADLYRRLAEALRAFPR